MPIEDPTPRPAPRPRLTRMVAGGALLAALILGAAALWARLGGSRPAGDPPLHGAVADFALRSQTGEEVTRHSLAGLVWIADFVFTRCAATCPQMTAEMARLQSDLAAFADLRCVSFSVDPEHDTEAVLRAYAAGYEADPERWLFLTGDKAAIYRLAHESFRLGAAEAEGGPEPILHSTRFVLVDREGIIRGYYDSAEPEKLRALRRDAIALLEGTGEKHARRR
jgi:protein SCO1